MVIGTVLGTRILTRLPQRAFRHVLAVLLCAVGVYMIATAIV